MGQMWDIQASARHIALPPMRVPRGYVIILTALLTVVVPLSGWAVGGFDQAELLWQVPLIAVNTLPLLLIRRNPLVVVLCFSISYPLWLTFGGESHILQSLPTLVAMYALGTWDRPLWLRAIGLATPMWMVGAALAGRWDAEPLELSFVAVVFVVVWGLGVLLAQRREYTLELEAKTASLERAERRLADQAVTEERQRIAREIHDVIAHAMSVITVQAGVGAHLIETRPSQAAESLTVIEHTGREALVEMRRMLSVLQSADSEGDSLGPQPGLADLPNLVQQLRHAGVDVDMAFHGGSRPLPTGLNLAAFRVAQEGLTNVAKHAPGSKASVEVRYLPDWLQLTVRNRVVGNGRSIVPGQGIRGMRERVSLYDGALDIDIVDGEFRLEVKFPIGEIA